MRNTGPDGHGIWIAINDVMNAASSESAMAPRWYNEMYDDDGSPRAHYDAYAGWLASKPVEFMLQKQTTSLNGPPGGRVRSVSFADGDEIPVVLVGRAAEDDRRVGAGDGLLDVRRDPLVRAHLVHPVADDARVRDPVQNLQLHPRHPGPVPVILYDRGIVLHR